jgi:hypothetical protein
MNLDHLFLFDTKKHFFNNLNKYQKSMKVDL